MDFLQKILRKDPKQRITVDEAIEHKFITMHMPSENISSDAEDDSNAIQAFMIKNHALEREALHTKNLLQNTKILSNVKSSSTRQLNFGSQMIEEPQSMILSRASMHQTKPFIPQSMQFSENQFGSYIFAQHPALQQLRSGCDPSTYKSYEDATPGFPKAGDTFITVNESPNNKKQQQQQLNESQFRQSQFYSSQLQEIEDEEEVLSFDNGDKQQQQEESKLVYLIEKQKSSALNNGNTVQRFNESTQNFTRLTGTAQQGSDHKFYGNEEFSSKRKFK